MKKLISLLVLAFLCAFASAQTRDSLIYRQVTVAVTHDTTYMVTVPTTHDSTYTDVDTVQVPIPVVTLKGMYMHPNQCTIGDATSENNFLAWCKREGANMLNCYARAYMYTESKRAQLAAFVTKAKLNYGIILVTVDVRFTDPSEEPGWRAYLAKYAGTSSIVEPLTEKEPWVYDTVRGYDYTGTFYLLRTMGNLCKQYGVKFNFYEGWMGNNYNGQSFNQAPVDSMVKYCDRIFISNYVTVSDYNSTSSSLGRWDNRRDKRCGYIAVAAPKFGKASVDIVELVSLEYNFLFDMYACPVTSTHKCNTFYGTLYQEDLSAYRLYSTSTVLQYTEVIGRTIFYSKYGMLAHP